MPKIILHTFIKANKEIVFDLCRSIDLHEISTQQTNEKAVEGVISGLIKINECVTWEAIHFGIKQRLTTKITEFKKPDYFTDEMIDGVFKSFTHQHIFSSENDGTKMIDIFIYKSPLGSLGRFANFLFLKKHMTQLLYKRNLTIKEFAKTDKWKKVLL